MRNLKVPGQLVVFILRNPGTDCGEAITETPDVISHQVTTGARVAELSHDFRHGEGLVNFHRGIPANPGKGHHMKQLSFLGDATQDPPDLLDLGPARFPASKLSQDLAPGSHLDGALVEVAAGPDHRPVRADNRCVRLSLIQIPGHPRRPDERVAEAGQVPCGDEGNFIPADLLQPATMGPDFQGTPFLVKAIDRYECEGMSVKMWFAKLVERVGHPPHEDLPGFDPDAILVFDFPPPERSASCHRRQAVVPVLGDGGLKLLDMKFCPALGKQVRDRWEVSPKSVNHAMETAPDFPDQWLALAIASPGQVPDGFRIQPPLLQLILGQPEPTPVIRI